MEGADLPGGAELVGQKADLYASPDELTCVFARNIGSLVRITRYFYGSVFCPMGQFLA